MQDATGSVRHCACIPHHTSPARLRSTRYPKHEETVTAHTLPQSHPVRTPAKQHISILLLLHEWLAFVLQLIPLVRYGAAVIEVNETYPRVHLIVIAAVLDDVAQSRVLHFVAMSEASNAQQRTPEHFYRDGHHHCSGGHIAACKAGHRDVAVSVVRSLQLLTDTVSHVQCMREKKHACVK
ncbi:hypothetical protein, conserved [Leishmania tarentolae]|uniref:Uncharacterized protein n=1 Tax=Leishmania tarentolae TaxID=5689 RepID=A0A640KRA2_LEITA|nr:hypothetical protein, conserved [Leishmania tarentolae]